MDEGTASPSQLHVKTHPNDADAMAMRRADEGQGGRLSNATAISRLQVLCR